MVRNRAELGKAAVAQRVREAGTTVAVFLVRAPWQQPSGCQDLLFQYYDRAGLWGGSGRAARERNGHCMLVLLPMLFTYQPQAGVHGVLSDMPGLHVTYLVPPTVFGPAVHTDR